jgi:cellulose synthase/poly-beta-1,6-N-acetylglucosamine synthase-like glycosyltransferase
MNLIWGMVAYVAAIGVWWRFSKYFKKESEIVTTEKSLPLISIIIPVRDEANTIASLLNSLLQLEYPAVEIIVVDDGSCDDTSSVVTRFPVTLISASSRPPSWIGKSWACHIGAQQASGTYLLFTDADTVHRPDSLKRAIRFLQHSGAKLVTAPAFHTNTLWWEKFLGPFYCMIHAGASPYDPVAADNPYALGQYLLVEKSFYLAAGGHAAVSEEVADDASLARLIIRRGGACKVYNGDTLCEVQMYRNFRQFWNGWLRILRLGMNELQGSVVMYTLLPLLALNVPNAMAFTLTSSVPVLGTLMCFAMVQPRLGNFSYAGVILFPIPMLLFAVLAGYAFVCHVMNLPVTWRGRKYFFKRNAILDF